MKTNTLNKHFLTLGMTILTAAASAADGEYSPGTASTSGMTNNTAGMPAPATEHTNLLRRWMTPTMLTSQQFVSDAAVGGIKEVNLGQLALEKSQNEQVKQFASTIVRDHTAANQKLMAIAEGKGLTLPPTNTFAADDSNWNNQLLSRPETVKGAELLVTNMPYLGEYQTILRLKGLSGATFDQAYVSDMVSDHAQDIAEFEMAARKLTDPELKQFAHDTLPTLREHYRMARQLANKLASAQPANNNNLQASGTGK